MSSSVTITFDDDTGVPRDERHEVLWRLFCERHDIRHSPKTVGGNIYYYRDMVEIEYSATRIRVSTYFMGNAMPDVARAAMAIWTIWGGTLRSDPEIRAIIVSAFTLGEVTLTPKTEDRRAK